MLSNEEAARVLGLKPSAASNRHIRALKRLKEIMAQVPGHGELSSGPWPRCSSAAAAGWSGWSCCGWTGGSRAGSTPPT